MRTCCVEGCIVPSEDTIFFEFPTSRTLRQRWLDVVQLSGKLTSDSMICSQHFLTTDYELVRGKTRLKRKVVPSQLLTITAKPPSPINCSDKHDRQISNKPNTRRRTKKSDRSRSPETSDTPQSPNKPISQQSPLLSDGQQSPNKSDSRHSTNGLDREPSPVNIAEKSEMCQMSNSIYKQSDSLENRQVLSDSVSRSVSDKLHPSLVPEDIEEELNKLEEEKRKKKSESLSKLSKGLSKISERLSRISDSLQGGDVRRYDCDMTNGGCDFFMNERGSDVILKNSLPMPDPKQTDIEEMITNYQIKNKIPNNALAVDLEETVREEDRGKEGNKETVEIGEVPDLDSDVAPVFIEISVGNDVKNQDAAPGTEDCLMLLESVQCEVDPATLMLPEPEEEVTITSDDEPPEKDNGKPDPISLLTSSDDDEVIIQEPHIDTVEVSDETDEDDMPLVKLVKVSQSKKKEKKASKQKDFFAQVMWGGEEFYCIQCQFTTTSRREYRLHRESHSTVLQMCGICSYTTASKVQYKRHLRNHKGEKRFKCHLCEYKARHNMSLLYHLKTHSKSAVETTEGRGYKCKKCEFRSDVKGVVLRHVKLCGESVRFKCGECEYQTTRRSDLRRHKRRKHKDEADDDEYYP